MKANHMNKSQLAGKLGTSKAFVTKVLTGDANLTFKTLTKIVHALDGRVSTKIVTNHKQVKWFEFIENNEKAKTEFIQKTEFDPDQKKGKFNEPALAA
jgi:transcriptional regulator with XRE-family HTH domain